MNKINKKQNRNRLIDSKNRLTAVRGVEIWGLGEKKNTWIKRKKYHLIDTGIGDYQT